MAKSCKKYMDVDVIAFLEKQMKSNTLHYQSDFDLDKEMMSRFVSSQYSEDKILLWLSRTCCTECWKESDAFVRDSDAHIHWRYFAEEGGSSFIAYVVELTGQKNGIIRGNCYELDYQAHAAEVAKKAIALSEYKKTFQDGFEVVVPENRSSYGFYLDLVDKHGAIVHSLAVPEDKDLHRAILAEQKKKRDQLREAPSKASLEYMIKTAEAKATETSSSYSGPEKTASR